MVERELLSFVRETLAAAKAPRDLQLAAKHLLTSLNPLVTAAGILRQAGLRLSFAADGVGRAPRPPVIEGESSRDDHLQSSEEAQDLRRANPLEPDFRRMGE